MLLFWGRVVDLVSPKAVFVWGLAMLALLNLVISFLPDQYSFFIFRALSGVAGASLIPASYRLITATFEGKQLQMALTLYGVSGAIANATGLLISGVIDLIPGEGQNVAWRWFFRIAALVIFPTGHRGVLDGPGCGRGPGGHDVWREGETGRPRGQLAVRLTEWPELKRRMLVGIATFIISLTFGATNGFKTAAFIAPLLVSVSLFVAFPLWEARIEPTHAILPPEIWRIPNLACLTMMGLFTYGL